VAAAPTPSASESTRVFMQVMREVYTLNLARSTRFQPT